MCAAGKHLNLLLATRNSYRGRVSFDTLLKIAVDKQLNLKIKKLFSAKRDCWRERGQIPEQKYKGMRMREGSVKWNRDWNNLCNIQTAQIFWRLNLPL